MDPTIRLRLATRIHFALLRQYGVDVAVSALLEDTDEAREALRACEGSGQPLLAAFAHRFKAASRPPPQDLAWDQDTSGFGVSSLRESVPEAPTAAGSWLDGMLKEFRRALRRSSTR